MSRPPQVPGASQELIPLTRKLASSGGMADRIDQQTDVAVVDAGEGLAQTDGRPIGEAGRKV